MDRWLNSDKDFQSLKNQLNKCTRFVVKKQCFTLYETRNNYYELCWRGRLTWKNPPFLFNNAEKSIDDGAGCINFTETFFIGVPKFTEDFESCVSTRLTCTPNNTVWTRQTLWKFFFYRGFWNFSEVENTQKIKNLLFQSKNIQKIWFYNQFNKVQLFSKNDL